MNTPRAEDSEKNGILFGERDKSKVRGHQLPLAEGTPVTPRSAEADPPVPVFVRPVDPEGARVFAPFAGIDVRDQHIFQAQVEAFVFGRVGEEEECPKTQGDEGT